MSQLMDMRRAKAMSYAICACFLVIHVLLFGLFRHYGITPMAYFNIFSIAFYLFAFLLIRMELLRTFVVTVYLEVVAHMCTAALVVGWESGFQISLIGLVIVAFYSEYIAHTLRLPPVPALLMGAFVMVSYLGALVLSHLYPAPYQLPEHVSFFLEFAWGVTVFSIMVTYLQFFVMITTRSEELLTDEALHDKLTRLPNRYYMADRLQEAVSGEDAQKHWVAMVDLDDFKKINDTRGHNCGDYVLTTVANLIHNNCGEAKLCRWGGEEFLLVGQTDGDDGQIFDTLERLRRTVAGYTFWYEEDKFTVTSTIGAARYVSGLSVEEWINEADKKLYEGKTGGKNRVVV